MSQIHSPTAQHTLDLYFWRDSVGNEVDLILETAQGLQPLEIKSGSTYATEWVQGIRKWQALAGAESLEPALVYGGTESFAREGLKVWGWRDVAQSTRLNLVTLPAET